MKKLVATLIFSLLLICCLKAQIPFDEIKYRPFFNQEEPTEEYEETSPSFTADGQTMVFAQYLDWSKKVPYIAHYKNGQWEQERLTFIDTLYNLAISPDGEQIIFEKFEFSGEEEITRTFIVGKIGDAWSSPKEVTKLYNLNAGYFQFMGGDTLLFFGRKPKVGIYFTTLDDNNSYSKPLWLSDHVSLDDSDSFDILMHPNQDKLIITQAYNEKKFPERGKMGFYYYEKVNEIWKRIRRLPLEYGWGASITPDGKFVFVRNDKIEYVQLEDINLKW